MAINQLNKYVWLVETIHRARKRGGITLKEIQSRWKDSDLSEGTIAESFYPILTNIFLIDKFLSFVGISEQCQDSAIQEFRQIRKPDMGIITSVGKEGHDNTCSLGDTQFIRNKTKIRFCFLIKLRSTYESCFHRLRNFSSAQ